jgi:UDP-sulfoquinovose synthase
MGLQIEIDHLPDPRVEAESHYYNAKHSKLVDLGLVPHTLSGSLVDSLINIAMRYRDRIEPALFAPQVNWRNARNQRNITGSKNKQPVLT